MQLKGISMQIYISFGANVFVTAAEHVEKK